MSLKETAITRLDDENFCMVYSCEPKYMKELKELKKKYPNEVLIMHDYGKDGIEAQVPAKWFKFVKPPIKKILTDEQKLAAAERMAKAREAKKND